MIQLSPQDRHPFRTKVELVHHTLRSAIMRCELEPGERLIIDDISKALGVSPIPVREALNQLQSEGLVTTAPHIGATVSAVSPGDVREIFTIMEGLELVAMRVATEEGSTSDFNDLQKMLAHMDDAANNNDLEAWSQLNIDFHQKIAAITGMAMLNEMTNRVLDRWDRVRRHVGILPGRLVEAQEQHYIIVQALMQHDVATLQDMAIRHNRAALRAYQAEFGNEEAHSRTAAERIPAHGETGG